tara:strand:+ start:23 stop:190 length:168 start_codon:yes stop_codon:yes gene_type:complete
VKVFTVYKNKDVKLELAFTWRAIFFFRLKLPNVSYNYRNPFKCLSLALNDIAKAN